MNRLIETVMQFLPLAVVLTALMPALRDWYVHRRRRRERPQEQSLIHQLVTLASFLLFAMWAAWSSAFGVRSGLYFLLSSALMWLVQCFGLRAVLGSGLYWARLFRRSPFDPKMARPLAGWLMAGFLFMLGWSALVTALWPTRPTASDKLVGLLLSLPPVARIVFMLAMASIAAVLEECLFRHYLLFRLATALRRGPAPLAVAMVLSTLLWSIGHYGLMQPYGLKLVQTFGLGLLLGATALRKGLVPAILLHWLFNFFLALMAIVDVTARPDLQP